MEDLSLHILDVAENSIRAEAKRIEIRVIEDNKKDLLLIQINDDGIGMDEETMKKAMDPFFTTKTTRRFGLGLSLLAQSAKEAEGTFDIESQPGKGTRVKAVFRKSHIDTRPLGDMSLTIVTLILANPNIDIDYIHRVDHAEYSLDTSEIRSQLNGMPINSPHVIKIIKNDIKNGIASLGGKHE